MSLDPQTVAPGPSAPAPVAGRRRWSGVVAPALAALVCALGAVVTWQVLVGTRRGQLVEEAAREGSALAREHLAPVSRSVLEIVSVPFLALVLIAAVALALVQRRWSVAVAAVVLLAGANLTTQVLQDVLVRPDLDATPLPLNSFPSGHATVAASVAATAVLISPPRVRGLVGLLGALLSAGIGVATMIGTEVGAWHRASDVLAAVLITAAWYFALEAGLTLAAGASSPSTDGRGRVRGAVRVLGVIGGLLLALGTGAFAAAAVGLPTSELTGVAYLGASSLVAGAVCGVQAFMIRLRPHHAPPVAA